MPTHENGPADSGASPRGYNTVDRSLTGPLVVESSGSDPLVANDVLDRLEAYAAKGWKVFPCYAVVNGQCDCSEGRDCESPGKHPRTRCGVKDATTDLARIRTWESVYPHANWASACGQESGVFVVDIDPRHGGFESMEDWETVNPLPPTLTALTGGGGRHLFYQYPAGSAISNRTNWLAGVDISQTAGT